MTLRWQGRRCVHSLQAIADVVEAIIGAAYITGGSETALNASKALRITVPSVDQWSDFARKALAPPPDVTTRLRPGTVEGIENIVGHKLNRPHILAQALVRGIIPYLQNQGRLNACG
jgi:endoribonuclease Dicer